VTYKFSLGEIVFSPLAKAILTDDQLASLLRRHASGAWDPDVRATNERAVSEGSPIFAKFWMIGTNGQPIRIWVLTEAERDRTLVMFPGESPYRASDLEEAPEPIWIGSVNIFATGPDLQLSVLEYLQSYGRFF
jgi:hypothetical protein